MRNTRCAFCKIPTKCYVHVTLHESVAFYNSTYNLRYAVKKHEGNRKECKFMANLKSWNVIPLTFLNIISKNLNELRKCRFLLKFFKKM